MRTPAQRTSPARLSVRRASRAAKVDTRGGSELIVSSELGWRRVGPGLVAELPGEAGTVWRRDGRCDYVLAALFELPSP